MRSGASLLLASLLGACGGAPPAPDEVRGAAADRGSQEAVAAPALSCAETTSDGETEYTFDTEGRVTALYTNSDAAAMQWREEVTYDSRGRRARIAGELLEGMGRLGPRPTIEPTYVESADARTVEVRYVDAEGERAERWTYDERGHPIRHEQLDAQGAPRMARECTYDERGRVSAIGALQVRYRGDEARPHEMFDGDTYAVTYSPDRIRVRYVPPPDDEEASDEDFPLEEGDRDLSGACFDVLFQRCAPMMAPPPPGRARARLPRP